VWLWHRRRIQTEAQAEGEQAKESGFAGSEAQ